MSKYKFDYLVNRRLIINENTGRQSELDRLVIGNPAYAKYNAFFKKLKHTLEKVGKVKSTHAREKALVYAIYLLGREEMHGGNTALVDLVNSYTRLKGGPQNDTPEFDAWIGNKSRSAQKRKEFTMIELVKKNIDYASSDEFFQTAIDPENIHSFLERERVPETSNRARGMAKHLERRYGMPVHKLHAMEAEVRPVLTALNKLQGYKKRLGSLGKTPRTSSQSIEQKSSSDPVSTAKIFRRVVEELLDTKKYISEVEEKHNRTPNPEDYEGQILYRIPESEIQRLLNAVDRQIDSGNGLSADTIEQKIIKVYYNSGNEIYQEFAKLLDEYFSYELEDPDHTISSSGASDYDEYDEDIINRLVSAGKLDNDMLIKLRAWLEGPAKISKEIRTEEELRKANKAMDKYLKSKEKPKDEQEPEEETPKKKGDTVQLDDDDDDYDEYFDDDDPEEAEEIGVMSYMSEQVQSDSYIHTHGQFIDRGFKKPINYHHYLLLNS